MKKSLLIFSLLCGFCAVAFGGEFAPKVIKTKILSISANGKTANVAGDLNILRNAGGVVVKRVNNANKVIVGGVVVRASGANLANLELVPTQLVKQEALPNIKAKPQVGDEVILHFGYQKALVIVPNAAALDEAVRRFSDIDFIHPDITAGELYQSYSPKPSVEEFSRICRQYAAGLVLFGFSNEFVFADCQTFEKVASFPAKLSNSFMPPFYSNLKHIPALIIDTKGKQIKNFDRYYKKLLEEKR